MQDSGKSSNTGCARDGGKAGSNWISSGPRLASDSDVTLIGERGKSVGKQACVFLAADHDCMTSSLVLVSLLCYMRSLLALTNTDTCCKQLQWAGELPW